MKKSAKVVIAVLLAMVFALFLSLGIECGLNLLSLSFSVSPDSGTGVSYPRLSLFCCIAGVFSLIAMAGLAFGNIKMSDKLDFSSNIWQLQIALSIILTLPMIKMWEIVIDFLRKTF